MQITLWLDKRRKTRDNQYPLAITITDRKKQKRIGLGFKIEEKYWKNGQLDKSYPDYAILDSVIHEKISHYKLLLLEAIKQGISIFDILDKPKDLSFAEFIEKKAKHYEAIGKKEYGAKVRQYGNDWDGRGPLEFYEHLIKIGNSINTIHKKFKRLRQIYTMFRPFEPNPFIMTIKKEPINRTTLSPDYIKKIEEIELSGSSDLARDMWLFSYYCKGMRFTNVKDVQNKDIVDGRVVFHKISKSNKKITVKIHDKLNAIIDKYKNDSGPLFPPMSNQEVNRQIKVIASVCGITKNISFHTSRHSVANNLQKKGVSVEVIRDVLGHSDTRVTAMYLKSLDDEAVDKAFDDFY